MLQCLNLKQRGGVVGGQNQATNTCIMYKGKMIIYISFPFSLTARYYCVVTGDIEVAAGDQF